VKIHDFLLALGLRIAAIVLFSSVLQKIPDQFATIKGYEELVTSHYFWLSVVLPDLILIMFSALLWFKPELIMRKFLREEMQTSVNNDFSHLSVVLLSAIGLYLALNATADISYYYFKWRLLRDHLSYLSPEIDPVDLAGIYASIVEIILGALLIFGSSLVTKKIKEL